MYRERPNEKEILRLTLAIQQVDNITCLLEFNKFIWIQKPNQTNK